nr:reverse transcriptase domain-containing protein [Tanacetum cinerariifolium]
MDAQLENIPHEALRMMDCTHCGLQMIENHSMDRLVKDVLMMKLVMHTKKNDTVFHTEKTGMLMLVVEINVGGMTADVVDKLTYSSDDVKPRQVDLRCAYTLTELHWHDIHVVPDRHEVDQRFISTNFSPLIIMKPSVVNPGYKIEIASGLKVVTNRIVRGCGLEQEEVHGERPEGNLKQLKTMKANEPKIKGIHVVREFLDVFSEDLSGKANVVADALSRKEWMKPRRARDMSITIHSSIKARILESQGKASKERLARLYLNEIVARHGVPVSIISDRDSHFMLGFWRSLQKALGTQLDLSMAYHPKTDGQSESTIQTLEDTLRACAMDFGENWDTHLPLVEFPYNKNYHSSVKCAPFEALYGRRCRMLIAWAKEIVQETSDKIVLIKKRLKMARDRQKSNADNQQKPLELNINDKVLLKVSH